ncbi:cupredoxin domain-containing protein [Candidatus Woesearchaeota archaeon]|nr:cupredoxin domain-containing protein [Candidatus Woesearchaeota archaeon]
MAQGKIKGICMIFFIVPFLFLSGCGRLEDSDTLKARKVLNYHQGKFDNEPVSGKLEGGVRVVEVKAYRFFFEPPKIVVNKGEKIRLVVSAEDVPHGFEIEGFEIPGYNIETVIMPGFPMTIDFIADEKGVWDIICTIYCGFGHSTMKGLFIVK